MKRTNWEAIRMEAIMGTPDPVTGTIVYPSLIELSAKYNVKYTTLTTKSSREKWKKRRQEALKETTDKVKEKIESLQIGTLTEKYKQDLAIIGAAKKKWATDMQAGLVAVKTSELSTLLKYEAEIYRAIYGVKKEPDKTIRLEIGKLDDSDRVSYIRSATKFIRSEAEPVVLQSAAG